MITWEEAYTLLLPPRRCSLPAQSAGTPLPSVYTGGTTAGAHIAPPHRWCLTVARLRRTRRTEEVLFTSRDLQPQSSSTVFLSAMRHVHSGEGCIRRTLLPHPSTTRSAKMPQVAAEHSTFRTRRTIS